MSRKRSKFIICPTPMAGRYVNIQAISRSEYLIICEIEVHGFRGKYLKLFVGSIVQIPEFF